MNNNGFILFSTIILLNFFLLLFNLLSESTLIQNKLATDQLYRTKVHYHALSAIPFIPENLDLLTTFTQPITKENIYNNTTFNLNINLESKLYLTKTDDAIYCSAILNNNARTIIKFNYSFTEAGYSINDWEKFND